MYICIYSFRKYEKKNVWSVSRELLVVQHNHWNCEECGNQPIILDRIHFIILRRRVQTCRWLAPFSWLIWYLIRPFHHGYRISMSRFWTFILSLYLVVRPTFESSSVYYIYNHVISFSSIGYLLENFTLLFYHQDFDRFLKKNLSFTWNVQARDEDLWRK